MNFVIVAASPAAAPSAQARIEAAGQVRASAQPPQAAASAANRRWFPRTGLDRPGSIGSHAITGSVACMVRNTSKHGALLEIDAGSQAADQLPECFTLVFLVNRIRSEVNCTIRWRARNRLGVAFVGPIHTSVGRRG